MKRLYTFVVLVPFCFSCTFIASAETEIKAVDIGEATLHYIEKGKGEPIIFVHGNTGSLHDWIDTVEIVSEKYRAIAYSRRFSIPNENTYNAPTSMLGQGVKDLRALAKHLGVERFHLVGLSWGGYVATVYAMRHPETLSSLTLAEPAYLTLLKETEAGLSHYERIVGTMPGRLIDIFATGDETEALRVFNEMMANQPVPALDLDNEIVQRRLANVKDLRGAAEALEGFPHVRKDALRQITLPTLLMAGEATFVGYFNLILDVIEAELPDTTRVVVPDAAHEMFLESPEVSSKMLMAFLEEKAP